MVIPRKYLYLFLYLHMEDEEVQLNVLILKQVRTSGKIQAKRNRTPLNRYVENLIVNDLDEDLKTKQMIDKS